LNRGRISIIIPVYNETRSINRTIDNVRSVKHGSNVEIIVVDGAEQRNTLKVIKDGKVKKIVSKKGRGAQMNAGALRAKGGILLFLHADTYLPENALDLIEETLSGSKVKGGAFTIRFDRINPLFRAFMFIHDLRSHITRIPYGDQAIFIEKEVFDQIGGYNDYPLFEDVDLMERMKKRRYRIKILPNKVIPS